MKVAVIGMGGTGSAAARFLARAGHEVVGFEQFVVGHARGSSHGESRIIRYTYADELYTRLMGEAYPLWRELADEAGEELLVRTGGVFFGDKASSVLASARAALDGSQVPYEWLEANEAQRRFPALRLAPTEAALFQPDMGYLRATDCVRALVRLARAHGAEVREETPVREVAQEGRQVVVTIETGECLTFDRVLVTAGPWMDKFFAGLRLPLRVTRQQVVYLKPLPGIERDFEADRLPVWIDADTNTYGFPADGRIEGVKLASHHPGEETDPSGVRRPPDESYQAQMADYATARFVGLTREVTHAQTCLYTNTPNEDFLFDAVPGQPHVWLVSGCSGHGFKFIVLLGKLAAEAATRGSVPPYLSRFALERFGA
jgi:sarcosine oxidase